MVLLGGNDVLEIASPILLISDISLICFDELSPVSNFGLPPWLKDNPIAIV